MSYRRVFLAVLATTGLTSAPAMAAQPSSGTVAPPNISAQWVGGPYTVGVPNQLGCLTPGNPTCDAFDVTVNLPNNYRFAVAIASEIEGDDYDLYVYYPDGTEAARSANAGGNESVVIVHNQSRGTGPYKVRVLPFEVTSGSTYQGIARSTSQQPIEPEDPNACLEAVPAALGISGITDLGQTVSLDVAVLLDGVSVNEANQIMTRAAISYAPLNVDLNVVSYTTVNFTGTEGDALIQQAKNHFGGKRPAGSDLVYVLSSKDLTTDGDVSLAGLADCIGGVRFPHRAFAVGEASGIEESLIGPFRLQVDAHPEVAAHELGHLMGGHHHYANCVEGNLQGDLDDLSPCTLMFNFVDFQSLNFSVLEGIVARGHAVQYASP
ncbi:MAG TPA: zinc-dependent metalloprotease family protein [Thermoanaerobaculia bacterium]|nr:zinc-dependent metalloprotease family protein [Thermoanaerobaculia bacterium]